MGKKPCFKWTAFLIDYVSAYKSQMVFMGLDAEADERRIKAESRVIMAEL